jgi:hypothetical protein
VVSDGGSMGVEQVALVDGGGGDDVGGGVLLEPPVQAAASSVMPIAAINKSSCPPVRSVIARIIRVQRKYEV